jgi:hypothetical protein
MKNYLADDLQSHGNAALIVWLNPDYDASRPTALRLAHDAAQEMST